ncbi:MAG: trypsin-like peptidase domain-containing protein, partial [Rhodospirillaceae bacterium]
MFSAKLVWLAGLSAAAAAAIAFIPNEKLHIPPGGKTFVSSQVEEHPAATLASIPGASMVPASSLADLAERIMPAVVNVAVKSDGGGRAEDNPLFQDPAFRRFFGIPDRIPRRQRTAAGSGVIVDADKGYIITNHHVIDAASEITVTLKDRREFTAKVVGSDKETDIALLQIEAKGLTALPIGDSDAMRVGDFVVAIGNPFGLGQTVTSGIVSATGRSGLNIEGYEDFIQTDAAINPGNSGGALVNLRGELIGINTAIVGPSGGNVGVGFAVPTSMAKGVMEQLAKT